MFCYTRGHVALSSSTFLADGKLHWPLAIRMSIKTLMKQCSLTFIVFQKHTFFSHKTFATIIAELSWTATCSRDLCCRKEGLQMGLCRTWAWFAHKYFKSCNL